LHERLKTRPIALSKNDLCLVTQNHINVAAGKQVGLGKLYLRRLLALNRDTPSVPTGSTCLSRTVESTELPAVAAGGQQSPVKGRSGRQLVGPLLLRQRVDCTVR
jgi:hypothetical protein